ncbi:MAG: hypothetical protein LBU88_06885 [Treponema sp.]|jgi:hypothetical protein|nr:hypothetical protein [Treponema sp.]
MQKKKSLKFKAIDLAIILFCLAGSVTSGAVFWQEYNRTLTKLNEDPIGTIVFKKRTAQRKFIDRSVWDTLKQTSPVYNGDTIRTIEFSEVIINFKDEVTHLALYEKTLIQVFYSEVDGAKIDFTGGQMEIDSGSGSVTITSGSSAITIEGQVNLDKRSEGFSLSVLEGEASFNGEKIEAGNILTLNAEGERDNRPAIALTSFGSSARIIGTPGQVTPVVFSWNTVNFNPDTFVIVEIARDGNFNNIVETRTVTGVSSVSIPVRDGNYWWRAYPAQAEVSLRGNLVPANDIYPSGTLEVIPLSTASLISPAVSAEFALIDSANIPLSWTAAQGASSYLLEISSFANMNNPVVSRRIEGTSVIQTGMEAGRWYWRVTPIFSERVIGSLPPSGIGSFSVTKTAASVPETAQELADTVPTDDSKTIGQLPPERQLDSLRTTEVPVISHAADWTGDNISGDQALAAFMTANCHIGRESIQGQERDVLTLNSNLLTSNEWRQSWFVTYNPLIAQNLKNASGVRFKILGDGGGAWLFRINTSDTHHDGCRHEILINDANRVVEIDVPFSILKQPDWGSQVPFVKNNIEGIEIARHSEYFTPNAPQSSTIKIFDFEIY